MSQNAYDYSYELRKERQTKITRRFMLVASVFVFISIFLNFILFPVYNVSTSMETDVAKGGVLFVSPVGGKYKRGDVVYLLRMDEHRLPWYKNLSNLVVKFFTLQKISPFDYTTRMSGKDTVRRLVGFPGDTYYMKDYILHIKPRGQDHFLTEFEVASRPYNIHIYSVPVEWNGMGACGDSEETVLGENEYFVLADNRIESLDSRLYGPVKASRIKGKVLIQIFPFNKLRLF